MILSFDFLLNKGIKIIKIKYFLSPFQAHYVVLFIIIKIRGIQNNDNNFKV